MALLSEDESERGSLFGSRRERAARRAAQAFDYASVTVQSTPTQTRFDIAAKYTIASDGVVQSVRINDDGGPDRIPLPSHTQTGCTSLPDGPHHGLGRTRPDQWALRIYFEDDFVGESTLALNLASDTLSLSLGPDPAIQVRRKLKGTTTNPTSSPASASCSAPGKSPSTTASNSPSASSSTTNFPLSNDEDVEVKAESLGGGKLDKDTGRVEWDITVKPSERKNIRFKYGVQAPRDTPIRLDS